MSVLLKMSNCWRMLALTGTDLSIVQASTAPTTISGIHTNAAFWYQTSSDGLPATVSSWLPPRKAKKETAMRYGVSSCTRETPKLPSPAWMPRAVPCLRRGKKYDVLGMKPENAPPPIPASKARIISSQ